MVADDNCASTGRKTAEELDSSLGTVEADICPIV
jgi:hypothetical protein